MAIVGILSLTVVATALFSAQAWMTDYDQRFTFSCLNNQVLTFIESIHDNGHEDRIWNFKCSDLPVDGALRDCKWSDYVNNFDDPVSYHCPNDGVMIGINSYHDNGKEDRRFSFMCCTVGDFITHKCNMTDYVNNWDGHLEFKVPANKVLNGIYSVHDNGKEDRRFKFDVCQLDNLLTGESSIVG